MTGGNKITFFMLVTERDCIIADYAISSYRKIYEDRRNSGRQKFSLYIYLNCLSQNSKSLYLEKWRSYPFTSLFDNALKDIGKPYPGEAITSPEGIQRSRDDYAESYDELWTTELKKFNSPYIATVDADFEILNPDFYIDLMAQLESNPALIGASSSHSPASYLFDTYSQRNIWLQERNHTWFCIYRKEAFELSSVSHFYYEEKSPGGEVIAFDSAAYFQNDLRVNHHLKFTHSDDSYAGSFVHYGAASKNKSLNKRNIGLYRRVYILATIGIFTGRSANPVKSLVNKIVRRLALAGCQNYLNKFTVERSSYIFEEEVRQAHEKA